MPKFAIVGGGGYIGYHIGVDLIINGNSIIIYDINLPDSIWVEDAEQIESFRKNKENLEFIKGDILCMENLKEAFQGTDCVIHSASFGMSGKEQMTANWDKTELINIQGTKNVIAAAALAGVRGLCYTSTHNVIFGGDEILNGDETLPYFPLHRHVDHYSRTKSIAEQLVLVVNGKQTAREGVQLHTCALRLAGVTGPKEKRHIPRVIKLWPLFRLRFGYGISLTQFVGIDNVVQAHVKSSLALLTKPEIVGGEAYFISDGVLINPFEYFRPLLESVGYGVSSSRNLPMPLVILSAYFVQFLHYILHPVWNFDPIMTPSEIYQTAVSHYFNNTKAQKDFGYLPQNPNDFSKICDYYCKKSSISRTTGILPKTNLRLIFMFLLLLPLLYLLIL